MPATAIQPERILKDLHELWAQLGESEAEHGGVLRACAMTLVVAAKDAADADRVRQTVGVLMHNHPARAIILAVPHAGDLEGHVFSECWKPFGKTQQICSEGIEISPGNGGLSEVARFLVPLRVPDLPVVLWCRGGMHFEPLFSLADKIVFDSSREPDADAALAFLRKLRASGRRVADLHWTRLTGWREVVSHLFDDGVPAAGEVTEARVQHGGGRVTTCTRYFESWIRTSLPNATVIVETVEGPAGVRCVILSTPSDSLKFTRGVDRFVEVSGYGRNYRAPLPVTSEESLMGEELGILGPDLVYERVLGV